MARGDIGGEGRVPLPLLEVDLVRLVEVDGRRYSALAATHAGARPLPWNVVLRRPAHGHAAADVVAFVVDEVAKVGAADRDEAVLGRGEEEGAGTRAAAEGHVGTRPPADVPPRGIEAFARRVEVRPSLAVDEGQAGELVVVAVDGKAGRGAGVVAEELEASGAVVAVAPGADAEWVGDGNVAAAVAAARPRDPQWQWR